MVAFFYFYPMFIQQASILFDLRNYLGNIFRTKLLVCKMLGLEKHDLYTLIHRLQGCEVNAGY